MYADELGKQVDIADILGTAGRMCSLESFSFTPPRALTLSKLGLILSQA